MLLRDVYIGPRLGGERFRLAPRALARSLKKQFQSRDVPAWLRGGPLLHGPAGELLYVPGLGVEGAAQASPGEEALHIHWVSNEPELQEPAQRPS